MSEREEIRSHITDSVAASGLAWWHHAALAALDRDHVIGIWSRDRADLYLLRFWLTPPRPSDEPGHKWESADSVLLHYILRPDDATALHDHPWGFTTTVLSGGYLADMPGQSWLDDMGDGVHSNAARRRTGPRDRRQVAMPVGDTQTLLAGDLHAIVRVLPSTWTLVRTGDRHAWGWGFHPAGLPWADHAVYLKSRPG